MTPDQLKFAETHEWTHVAQVGGDTIATIGISKFAIEQLSDVVYLALPSVGKAVTAGKEFGEIESVKAVSNIYSTVDGVITEVNTSLPENLETLNSDPYGAGWMIKVKVSNAAGLDKLMNYSDYEKQCSH